MLFFLYRQHNVGELFELQADVGRMFVLPQVLPEASRFFVLREWNRARKGSAVKCVQNICEFAPWIFTTQIRQTYIVSVILDTWIMLNPEKEKKTSWRGLEMSTPTARMNHSMWHLLTFISDPSVWRTCCTFVFTEKTSSFWLLLAIIVADLRSLYIDKC